MSGKINTLRSAKIDSKPHLSDILPNIKNALRIFLTNCLLNTVTLDNSEEFVPVEARKR